MKIDMKLFLEAYSHARILLDVGAKYVIRTMY